MPLVTLSSSVEGKWQENFLLHPAVEQKLRTWKLKFCREESGKTGVACVEAKFAMRVIL
jgi:hypothetical protein